MCTGSSLRVILVVFAASIVIQQLILWSLVLRDWSVTMNNDIIESIIETAVKESMDINTILFGNDVENDEDDTNAESVSHSDATSHTTTQKNGTLLLPPLYLIPKPTKLKQSSGHFIITATTKLCLNNKELISEAQLLAETLRASTGFAFPVVQTGCELGHICLVMLEKEQQQPKRQSGLFDHDEAYAVDVRKSGVIVGSFTRKGIFYGTQTLLQLLPPSIYSSKIQPAAQEHWRVPFVHIEDAPRFSWRGMHLDVSRHFMPKIFVMKLIHLLSIHKMNSLHLHLTEDQGWRVEIKRYPLLTNISAWRDETLVGHADHKPRKYDGKRHGGFYRQQDIRDMVAFAEKRHVTIVPEIEMPGHTQAVFAAYPEHSCRPNRKLPVMREWGVSDNVFCAGKDSTFEFLEHILEEVMELFPSEYIHIGGDECSKKHWQTCPACRQRMRDEGLRTTEDLQGYFIRRIQKFVASKGRKLMGWDEIFQGGLAPNASVRQNEHEGERGG